MDEQQMSGTVKATFNTISNGYDNPALQFFPNSADHLASCLRLRGDERVLDVATGTGHAALALARRLPRGRVTAVDFSAGMLAQAHQKAADLNLRNVEFVEMDMQAMRFETEEFDIATCAFGIFFVETIDRQLAHIAEKVRDGGAVAITSFHEDYMQPLRGLLDARLSAFGVSLPPRPWKQIGTEAGCVQLFENAGLTDVRVERKNMGYCLKDERRWWDIVWNAGFRGSVARISPTDRDRFKREHLEEIAELTTEEGIRLDIDVMYTIGSR